MGWGMGPGKQRHYRTWNEWFAEWTESEFLFLFYVLFAMFGVPMTIGLWIAGMALIVRVCWMLVFGLELR